MIGVVTPVTGVYRVVGGRRPSEPDAGRRTPDAAAGARPAPPGPDVRLPRAPGSARPQRVLI
ncbi:hypothetical protein SSCG_00554 [Streptomyces clavuligerus]|nr:hypothetical protein SSCG_00554 [Streptomyces clavuligerus]